MTDRNGINYTINMKKILSFLREVFTLPKLKEPSPDIRSTFIPGTNEALHRHNIEEIALADLQLHKEALEKNLILLYYSVAISFLAMIVSITALIVAITIKC